MAVPGGRNGLREDDDDIAEHAEVFDGASDEEDVPPHLRALANAAQSGDVSALLAALGGAATGFEFLWKGGDGLTGASRAVTIVLTALAAALGRKTAATAGLEMTLGGMRRASDRKLTSRSTVAPFPARLSSRGSPASRLIGTLQVIFGYCGILHISSAIFIYADNHDGSIDVPVEDGDTLLHLACLYGHLPCVQLLLERGASLECKDEEGAIPLHDACAGGFTEMVQYMLNFAANRDGSIVRMLNTVDSEGDTPLHHAARGEHLDVVKLLLEAGASPKQENSYGQTPADMADQDTEVRTLLTAKQIEASTHMSED
nr:unnamed protein product [Digitaria exilis]